jgi:hypothetical protein
VCWCPKLAVKEAGLKKFLRSLRVSSVGVFFAGIIGVIQGCSIEREGALFAALLFLLNFCSGPIEDMSGDTTGPQPIIIYDSGRVGNGDIGDRATTTAICENAASRPAGHSGQVLALLSYSGDALLHAPTNHGVPPGLPVVGPTGVQISADWAGLWDGGIDATLAAAGVFPAGTIYWTGTHPSGNGNSSAFCNNWTDGTSSYVGAAGNSVESDSNWIQGGQSCNATTVALACVAY